MSNSVGGRSFQFLFLCGLLLAAFGTLVGHSQEAKPSRSQPTSNLTGSTFVAARELAVRDVGENDITEKTKRMSYEVQRDNVTGALIYVSNTGSISACGGTNNFELRICRDDGIVRGLVRFNLHTGQAWMGNYESEFNSYRWSYIKDSDEIGLSEYDVVVTPAKSGFWAMRIDRRNGRTWDLATNEWKAVNEPN